MSTSQRVALVTGAGQGIGRAIALALARRGLEVVIAEQDVEAGQEAEEAIVAAGGMAQFLMTDVADDASVRKTFAAAVDRAGRLDALVNNAAIADPYNGPLEDLTLAEWQRRITVNLTGAFLCTREAIPLLRTARGAIVNIGSSRAVQSEPDTEAYAASKGGLVSLTHALSVSLGPHIRVNCISPGWIDVSGWQKSSGRQSSVLSERDHAQHPAGRVGQPDDIASLAVFLLLDEPGFVTGQHWVVDGGMTRKMIYGEN